jgi:hypothetical protein
LSQKVQVRAYFGFYFETIRLQFTGSVGWLADKWGRGRNTGRRRRNKLTLDRAALCYHESYRG